MTYEVRTELLVLFGRVSASDVQLGEAEDTEYFSDDSEESPCQFQCFF
jgi:hypothetical protein